MIASVFVSIWLVCVNVVLAVVDVVTVVVFVAVVVVVAVIVVVVVVTVTVVVDSAAFSKQIHHPVAAPPAAVPCGIQLIASFVSVSPTGDNEPLYLLPFTNNTSLLNSVENPQTLSFAPAGPKIWQALELPVGYAPG